MVRFNVDDDTLLKFMCCIHEHTQDVSELKEIFNFDSYRIAQIKQHLKLLGLLEYDGEWKLTVQGKVSLDKEKIYKVPSESTKLEVLQKYKEGFFNDGNVAKSLKMSSIQTHASVLLKYRLIKRVNLRKTVITEKGLKAIELNSIVMALLEVEDVCPCCGRYYEEDK